MTAGNETPQGPDRPMQLTIDGGEVRHPPPAPRVMCPQCEKKITLTQQGELRHHTNGWGDVCPMTGQRYRA